MERNHDELKDLIVPYALGAIPEDEMGEIRAHILECEECMAEADKFADAASSLAYAAPAEPLPSGFADRVIDLAHVQRAAGAPARGPQRARRWWLAEALSFAALVVAVAVLSFGLVDARHDAEFDHDVVAALLNSDQGLKLEGSGGRGIVVPAEGDALFVAQGLGAIPSDRTYELWLMHGDCASGSPSDCTVVSAGTFEARGGVAVVRTSKPLSGFEQAAVTIEPEGGSDAPTTTPVITSL